MSAAGPRILRSQVRVRSLVGAWGRSAPNDGSEAPGFPFHPQHARHKALAIAIAGALAAPTMAAQAVDFTLSGQVGRTLFVNDSDTSTNPMSLGSDGEIRDNNGATRFRLNGSSELDDGSRIGIQFEMGVNAGVLLRHANVQYTSSAGRITVGQGSEAGDSSAGVGVGVTGIGAGQDGTKATFEKLTTGAKAGTFIGLGSYFSSLDGGTRANMIRYDTPTIGPVSAAVSVSNGDRVSGLLALSTDAGGTAFAAKLGAYKMGDQTAISGSAGVTLPSGLAVAGAWGRGDDVAVLGTASAAVAAVPGVYENEWRERFWMQDPANSNDEAFNSGVEGDDSMAPGSFAEELAQLFPLVPDDPDTPENDQAPVLTLQNLAFDGEGSATRRVLTPEEADKYRDFVRNHHCVNAKPDETSSGGVGTCEWVAFGPEGYRERRTIQEGTDAVLAGTDRRTDPSYVMARVGYTFGNTTVAASWYSSEDFIWTGAEGTAIGFGASHALPKVGASIHASVQNYEVDFPDGRSQKETVFQLGTLVTF